MISRDSSQPLRISDIPASERPRERLLRHGPERLSAPELLAIILRAGAQGENALTLANRLLSKFGDLRGVASATVRELCEIRGMGKTKSVQVKAAFELGRRSGSSQLEPGVVLMSPEDIVDHMTYHLGDLDREHFCALLLNTRGVLVGETTVSIGSLNASIVHPRELFRDALRHSAASIIVVHNHPSGDPSPSQEDIALTRRLVRCGRLMGIEVLDHVIIASGSYQSMKELGLI